MIKKVGYEPVEIEFEEVNDYFTHLELNLKEEEFLPKDRNFSAKVLPARNFIPNAEFKTKDNKLPHWEIFDDSIVEQKEKGDVEKKLQQVTLKADKTLKTERIAVPKDSNLKFSHSGTAQAEITLVDKDGIPTPVTNPTKFPTNQASYLIIEFTTGTIKEPFLQLIDDLGGTDYYYNSQQYPDEFDARAGLACCPQDYCWNGYACVEPMNIFAEYTQISEHIEEGRDYRCIQGEWKHSPIRWDWQGLNWGFCEKNSQCFVTKEGSPEFETENFYENNPPICIDNEDYVLDHYCEKGDWSSRTKFLASTLLEAVEDDDYVIYCTNYKDAFINYGDEFKLGGGFPFVKDVLPGTPLDEAETEELYTCFEDLPAIVEMEENTCINNVCVIMFEDGAKRAFATTLNKDITDPNSFLQTLNIQTDENPCQGTGNYIECETEQGELWYSEKLNAVIYSKQSIQMTPSVIDKVVDWFKDLFGIDAELSDQNKFVQEAKNFRELYLLSKGDKKAKAIKEVFPYNKTLIAEYENFQTPICDYVTVYDLGTELLETLSGMKKLSCTQDNATNLQSVEIVADDEALDFFWPQLTGKLRVG